MPKVKILRDCRVEGKNVKAGSVVDVEQESADILIGQKQAELYQGAEEEPKEEPKEDKKKSR